MCSLVFGCCKLSYLIFLKLRKKERTAFKADQIRKMTTIFTQNGPSLSLWVKMVVILWICSALQAVLSFSAWERSRDSTRNGYALNPPPPKMPHPKTATSSPSKNAPHEFPPPFLRQFFQIEKRIKNVVFKKFSSHIFY